MRVAYNAKTDKKASFNLIPKRIRDWARDRKMKLQARLLLKNQYPLSKQKEIIAEYNLIQDKKSNLSKSERDATEKKVAELIAFGIIKVKGI